MNIRFPTDNDPGMSRQRAPRKPGGGGKIFFMLIIGVVIFMLMRVMSSGPQNPVESNPTDRSGEYGSTSYPDLQSDQQPKDRGDWGLEDGPVQRNAESKKPTIKSSNSDWDMESVATKQNGQQETASKDSSIKLVIEGPSNVRVGEQANFSLRVENNHDRPIKNLQMKVAYDSGLVRPGRSNPAQFRLTDRALQVGKSEAIQFAVTAKAAGQQCISVTVTADGVRSQTQTACVKVSKVGAGLEPKSSITKQGDWSLDTDVKTTPKPTEPKKTTKGDWGLEEVD